MSEKLQSSKTLAWIFYIVGAGSLIASGIYLEKVMLLGPSSWDVLRALAFGLMGLVILGVPLLRE